MKERINGNYATILYVSNYIVKWSTIHILISSLQGEKKFLQLRFDILCIPTLQKSDHGALLPQLILGPPQDTAPQAAVSTRIHVSPGV
mmetsp:Transcript_4547/g.8857  ORF Transcript_4547/g.8857 Transcript_4547/m.8857 type:complete len:88 (-) Transcript_4547:1567-1830(-)